MIFKYYALFADCMSEIYNKHIENAKDLDFARPMYNLTEYDNYSKTSGRLWQCYRDEPTAALAKSWIIHI